MSIEHDIVELAAFIRRELVSYVQQNPHPIGNYDKAVLAVVGSVMKETRGHMNPQLVRWLVMLDRMPWRETKYALPC